MNNQEILVAQSGDTMTAPDHRGKGLFIILAKKAYKLAAAHNIRFIFGFPNENSFPGFKNKLNWKFSGNMFDFSCQNNVVPLCELSFKFHLLNNLYLHFVRIRLKKYKVSVNEAAPMFRTSGFCVPRNPAFFTYKLSQSGNFLIRFQGFYFLIKPENHLQIGDVSFFQKEEFPNFVKALKKISNMLGCKKTLFSVNENHWLYFYLINSNAFMRKESLPIGFMLFDLPMELSFHKIAFTRADYDTF